LCSVISLWFTLGWWWCRVVHCWVWWCSRGYCVRDDDVVV